VISSENLDVIYLINLTLSVRVITDDMDYATVPNLQVFTSNRNVIQTASQQGKLLRR
jgi:hypothetical protein